MAETAQVVPPPTPDGSAQWVLNMWLGQLYTAQWIDALLMGILSMQFGRYLKVSYAMDARYLRAIVVFTFVFSLGGSIFTQFVQDFGSFNILTDNRWFPNIGVMTPLQSAPVQLYYALRAYKLYNNSKTVLATILGLMLVSVAGAINTRISEGGGHLGETLNLYLTASVNIWLWTSVLTDLLISTLITIKFIRSKTGWAATNTLLRKLIRLTWESSLPPTLYVILVIVDFQFKPSHFKYLANVLMAKIYGLTLLYGLNERVHLRRREGASLAEYSSGGLDFAQESRGGTKSMSESAYNSRQEYPLTVMVTKEEITNDAGAAYADRHEAHSIAGSRTQLIYKS